MCRTIPETRARPAASPCRRAHGRPHPHPVDREDLSMPNRCRVAIALLALIVALPGVALAQPQILPPAGLVPLDSVVDVSQLPDETAVATATTPKPALSPSGT